MCETLIGKASKTSNKNSENEPKHTNTKMPHNYKSMQVRGLTVCVCERTETAAVSAAVLLRGLPTLFCGLPFSMLMICKHKHKRTNTKPRSQKQNSKNTTIITAHRKYAPYTTAVAKKKKKGSQSERLGDPQKADERKRQNQHKILRAICVNESDMPIEDMQRQTDSRLARGE